MYQLLNESMTEMINKIDLQSKDKSMNDSISMKETMSMTELKRLRDKLYKRKQRCFYFRIDKLIK